MCLLQMDCSSSRRTHKINFRMNQKGYKKSETTYVRKALGEENPELLGIFLCDLFLTSFFKITNFQNSVQTKMYPAESDLPRRILLCRGIRSF